MDPQELLSKEQLAAELKVSVRQVDKLRNKYTNFPKPIMLGSRPRWRRSAIHAFIDSLGGGK